MAIARWKDLCIDATDAPRLGRFWGQALGLTIEIDDDGDAVLRGEHPGQTIWVNTVPEPKTVKQRVHIDLNATTLGPLLALGATMLLPAEESGHRWSVLADPEGGELCVFVRDGQPGGAPATFYDLVVDTADEASSRAAAEWWAEVLGGRAETGGRGYWWTAGIEGAPFTDLDFVPVPEPKSVKNRIHWDITSDDVAGLVERGATLLAEPTDATRWHVLADPEGNEFCVFAP